MLNLSQIGDLLKEELAIEYERYTKHSNQIYIQFGAD